MNSISIYFESDTGEPIARRQWTWVPREGERVLLYRDNGLAEGSIIGTVVNVTWSDMTLAGRVVEGKVEAKVVVKVR